MATGNAINANSTGLVRYNGTGTFDAVTTTNHDILIGAASNGITNVAPSATSGVPLISQGASADPAFGTAVVAGGGTGIVTTTAYGLIAGGTTATGNFQNTGTGAATSTVLIGNGASALPSFSATPQITGLGIGAASTGSGLTFDGSNTLANYATATWTPNLQINGSNTGITYSSQLGGYTRIGNVVNIWFNIGLTSKGASVGNVTISNLPITPSTNGSSQALPVTAFGGFTAAGFTIFSLVLISSSAVGVFSASGSGLAQTTVTNAALSNTFTVACSGIYILD